MLEAIDRPAPYYERRNWDYPALARALGAEAERVTTAAELGEALRRAEAAAGAYLIEALTARDDLSPVMARIRNHIKSAGASGRSLIGRKHLATENETKCVARFPPERIQLSLGLSGTCLIGITDWICRRPSFGHRCFPESECVVVAEDVLGGGRQNQP